MSFDRLGLAEPLLRALRDTGYTTPTPIQVQAIPPVLAGRDVLGCAQTGTGKTAAFALPILQRLSVRAPVPGQRRPLRCLVLTPTRELAAQIGESFRTYGKHLPLTSTVIFGGVGQHPQEQAMRRGVDILVATPGRLLDLMGQGIVSLGAIEVFVLDEADRMLDMGFIHDIRKVIDRLPRSRQTQFFSATMPAEIKALADSMLRDPVTVSVTPVATTAETVVQSVYFVNRDDKPALLEHLLGQPGVTRVLVFTRTKHGADKVAKRLNNAKIAAEAIHGNKSQNARMRALANFKKGTTRVLVASDIAARGLDIDEISHVINFEIPNEPETYVHRIGRTGRAGASGLAVSLCDGEERAFLRDIERLIRKPVPVVAEHPFAGRTAAPRAPQPVRAPGHAQQRNSTWSRPHRRDDDRRPGSFRGRRDQRPASGPPAVERQGGDQLRRDQPRPVVRDVARPAFKPRSGPRPPAW